MNWYGQLYRAQLENLSSDPTPALRGRMFYNTASGKAKLDTGAAIIDLGSTSLSIAQTAKTANYTLLTSDDMVTGDSSGGAFTLTLPTAVGNTGKVFWLKKIDSSLTQITIATTSAQTIDGASGSTLATQNEVLKVVSNGSNWRVLGRYIPSVWTAYTPTLVGFGSGGSAPTNLDARWRRVVDSLEIMAFFTCGTSTATAASISLPSGLTIGTVSSGYPCGIHTLSANADIGILIATTSAAALGFSRQGASSTGQNGFNGDQIATSTQGVSLRSSGIPIVGWKG